MFAGLFDNVLSDYLWARAVMLVGKLVMLASTQSANLMFGGHVSMKMTQLH